MGLAATRTKQRFGLDPRNTAWSNDTSRFGHQQLEKFGWKPGMGLGMKPLNSHKSHIKVHIKDDNVGLGAKIKRKERADEFDNGECAGLDVFQRILGRLNGNEDKINQELDIQRKEKIFSGKWGVHFVKGEVLASTWDPKTKKLKSYSSMDKSSSNNKRSRDESSSDESDSSESSESSTDENENEKEDGDEPDKKKRKKEKKKAKKLKKKAKKLKKKEAKKLKKEQKKEKKEKKTAKRLESSKTAHNIPESISTRLSVRSKWIKQKRAAIMDSKALNEIFMITNE